MSWSHSGVDATIGLHVNRSESVSLRLSSGGGGAYLAIGDKVEISLAQTHIADLREQAAIVLNDMDAFHSAERAIIHAHTISHRAATTAEHAKAQAVKAMAAGAHQQAMAAEAAATKAAQAAAQVRAAVQAALEVIHTAEEATESAGEAAAIAARAAALVSDDTPGEALSL